MKKLPLLLALIFSGAALTSIGNKQQQEVKNEVGKAPKMNLARRTETHTAYTSYIYFEPEDLIPYSGHGQDWFELHATIGVSGVQQAYMDTVEYLSYANQSNTEFFYENIFFDSYDQLFYVNLYTRQEDSFGRIRIQYSYEEPVEPTLHSGSTGYFYFNPSMFTFFSGHGQDWYELNVSISAPGIPVESYYNVEITGFQIQGYANFYSNDIWFNWDTGRFEGRLFSRTNMNFGSLRINYTYLGY